MPAFAGMSRTETGTNDLLKNNRERCVVAHCYSRKHVGSDDQMIWINACVSGSASIGITPQHIRQNEHDDPTRHGDKIRWPCVATSPKAYNSVPFSYRVLIAAAIGLMLVTITLASTTM